MKAKKLSRVLAVLLCACMLISVITVSVAAESTDYVSETHSTFQRTTSTVAPGVTQDICYAYNNEGKQIVYYVATADVSRDDVIVQSSYKDAQCTDYGMAKLTEQMASASAKYTNPENANFISEYYAPVVGVNGDFYNMTTGRPSGAFAMDGVLTSTKANNRPFFAIMEDGTAVTGKNNTDWDAAVAAHGNAVSAVGGSMVLVKDGADVTANASGSYETQRHCRTCVGVTAEGKVIMMVLDGRQEPFSAGGTMHECAQIMLEAGCVEAINLDGGGSTTYVAKEEGSDSLSIVNRPSDGSERSISSGLIIASTAAPSNVFDHTVLTPAASYVTPGSTVSVAATGVSPAGTSADIPENVTYSATLGTVDANGTFTSDGTVGDAQISMLLDEKVVGTATIHVAVPKSISFEQSTITVPYGKTVKLDVTALCDDVHQLTLKPGDINFTLDDNTVGTVNGFDFTASNDSASSSAVITAQSAFDSTVTATASLSLGVGAEILHDFENEDNLIGWSIASGYPNYAPSTCTSETNRGQLELGEISIVDSKNGKVHSGNKALRVDCDFSQTFETGYLLLNLRMPISVVKDAKTLGTWVYIPTSGTCSLNMRWLLDKSVSESHNSPNILDIGQTTTFDGPGWHYLEADISGLTYTQDGTFRPFCLQIYCCDRDNTKYNYKASDYQNQNGKFTLYFDDITVTHSSAVDDNEAPVFSSVTYAASNMSDAVELNGQTVNDNNISFAAKVSDDTRKGNAVGIDASASKVFIDGQETKSTYKNGVLSATDCKLTDGYHTVKFVAVDKNGNENTATRKINVNTGAGADIKVVPENTASSGILFGSQYWVDVVAKNIENVSELNTVIALDTIHMWELEHMQLANGFEGSCSVANDSNDAVINIKKTGTVTETGEAVIARLPIRVWYSTTHTYPGYEKYTPAGIWAYKTFWGKRINVNVVSGLAKFTDDSTSTFSSDNITALCEVEGKYATIKNTDYYKNNKKWHTHTEEALENKAATCTEDGYEGRTYCKVCDSIVDWGTAVPATGHNYENADGVIKCSNCELLLNGELDGKLYKDGVLAEGWINDSYYTAGENLTGIKNVDGYYYNFGDDGVCRGQTKYTGLFYDEADGVYRYAQLGEISTGWKEINSEWYYFRNATKAAAVGEYYYSKDIVYNFTEQGKLISPVWVETANGTRYFYGPSFLQNGWKEINGDTYYFDSNGYRYEGYHYVIDSNSYTPQWYDFGDDGVLKGKLTTSGLLEVDGKLYYLENGISQTGLFLVDNDYYYFRSANGYAAITGTYYITETKGLLDAGEYTFGPDYKMVKTNGIVTENGHVYYYEDGVLAKGAGLISYDGGYYYVRTTGEVALGRYYVTKNNGLMPSGYYDFDTETGKMIIEYKDGLVNENGGIFYYKDGVLARGAGLIKIGNDYYYIRTTGQAAVGTYYVTTNNGLMQSAYYDFDTETGKMIIEYKDGFVNENGGIFYYNDGVLVKGAGLIEIDGDYYYVRTTGQLATGHYYVTVNNGLMKSAYYDFDAQTGKMILG